MLDLLILQCTGCNEEIIVVYYYNKIKFQFHTGNFNVILLKVPYIFVNIWICELTFCKLEMLIDNKQITLWCPRCF